MYDFIAHLLSMCPPFANTHECLKRRVSGNPAEGARGGKRGWWGEGKSHSLKIRHSVRRVPTKPRKFHSRDDLEIFMIERKHRLESRGHAPQRLWWFHDEAFVRSLSRVGVSAFERGEVEVEALL
jgi:hypothetical protein